MTAYSGGSGHDIFGQALDTEPVAAEFRHLFPPGTFDAAEPGAQMLPKRTLIHDPAPRGKKKRPKPRKAK